jgi:S-adenosylmethionine-diacylgycerolhomoserine-N-methlytransferase
MSAVGRQDDPAGDHAALMDGVYRYQRHIYDLTRKYYLLGRDRLIAGLDLPREGTVLEIGCGTGRNLVLASRRYPDTQFFGLDISAAMLHTAAASLAREGIAGRTRLAEADATDFDALALFGRERFDRVFISYALSMIPGWERAIAEGIACLAPGGSLHIVDFGGQERLPGWFRNGLRAWLAKFHVSPRDSLRKELERQARAAGMSVQFETLYRGYAVRAVVRRPGR